MKTKKVLFTAKPAVLSFCFLFLVSASKTSRSSRLNAVTDMFPVRSLHTLNLFISRYFASIVENLCRLHQHFSTRKLSANACAWARCFLCSDLCSWGGALEMFTSLVLFPRQQTEERLTARERKSLQALQIRKSLGKCIKQCQNARWRNSKRCSGSVTGSSQVLNIWVIASSLMTWRNPTCGQKGWCFS